MENLFEIINLYLMASDEAKKIVEDAIAAYNSNKDISEAKQ